MKIHEVAGNPEDGKVEPPMFLDPRKRRLYSADGHPLVKGSGVFIVAHDDRLYRGTVRRVDFKEMTVVVGTGTFRRPYNVAFNIESYDLGNGISFDACPALGVDEFRLDL